MELAKRALAKRSIEAYSIKVCGFWPAKHHKILLDALWRFDRGEIDRLIVLMPPGSAKSTYTSMVYPSFALAQDPSRLLIHASHTTDFVQDWGGKIREVVESPIYRQIFPDTQVSKKTKGGGEWETTAGGKYLAKGVGATITGRRMAFGLIDDPIEGREDADRPSTRDRLWKWYIDDFRSRKKPGARIAIVETWWHEDDLVRRLIQQMEDCDRDDWTLIRIPAICPEIEEYD